MINNKETFIIAELGINHNGSLEIAKKLIDGAVDAKCNAIKFQKRTIDLVYSKEELDKPRESPWGTTTREQKYGLEFNKEEYNEIDKYCRDQKIEWFASAWDVDSQKFLKQYNLKYNKVASPMLTHKQLIEDIASEHKYTFISTGMSTLVEIGKAVTLFRDYECPFELMHTNSVYPCPDEDINLCMINYLKKKFHCDVGYSGHEAGGFAISYAAVALGATSIERHITLDRSMYGSDQSASIELETLKNLVGGIRKIELAMGNGIKTITKEEEVVKKKLRKINTL